MAAPDFSKQTIETLAQRSRYQCSNPDCAVQTIGPNSDPEKTTTIGEAAHIFGAKPGSARYDIKMSDVTRAAITNGIWLCRNCHGKIDRDTILYSAELLLSWRKSHEDYVLRELGTRGDRIRHEMNMRRLDFLAAYPPLIQRIAIDKPSGWEWRFAAELMRHLNNPEFKRLRNLRAGHYYHPYAGVALEDVISWITERTQVMSRLLPPLAHLFDRLTASFGPPGESGEIEEISDVCNLIHNMLFEMVSHEEILHFTPLPTEAEELREILSDLIGRNTREIEELPSKLDEIIAMIGTEHGGTTENPLIINWKVPFDIPEHLNDQFVNALDRYVSAVAD
jgi:hypothetical protein